MNPMIGMSAVGFGDRLNGGSFLNSAIPSGPLGMMSRSMSSPDMSGMQRSIEELRSDFMSTFNQDAPQVNFAGMSAWTNNDPVQPMEAPYDHSGRLPPPDVATLTSGGPLGKSYGMDPFTPQVDNFYNQGIPLPTQTSSNQSTTGGGAIGQSFGWDPMTAQLEDFYHRGIPLPTRSNSNPGTTGGLSLVGATR